MGGGACCGFRAALGGGDIPKQYREIAGAPLLEHTLRVLLGSADVRGVVVALDPSDRRADAIASLSDVRVQTVPGVLSERIRCLQVSSILRCRREMTTGFWCMTQPGPACLLMH